MWFDMVRQIVAICYLSQLVLRTEQEQRAAAIFSMSRTRLKGTMMGLCRRRSRSMVVPTVVRAPCRAQENAREKTTPYVLKANVRSSRTARRAC